MKAAQRKAIAKNRAKKREKRARRRRRQQKELERLEHMFQSIVPSEATDVLSEATEANLSFIFRWRLTQNMPNFIRSWMGKENGICRTEA